ncbi:MAG: hypothetical protein JSV86_11190 [Gemmatimonadota bacterium]|nr:MAG: hypothetical protein JSV86_11190 [Gemmatimonadota bacterium]
MTSWKGVHTPLATALVIGLLAGCGDSGGGDGEVPGVLRAQFQTQMRTILHDLQTAEEQAAVIEGAYLNLEELRGRYFNRPVPENYELSLTDVSPDGYRAEIVHRASGLRCRLEVGGSGRGAPTCD